MTTEVYMAQTNACPPEFPDVLECFADRAVADAFAVAANVGLHDDDLDDQEAKVVIVPMKVNTATTVPPVRVTWRGVFILDDGNDRDKPGGYTLIGDLTHPFFRPANVEPTRDLAFGGQVAVEAMPAVRSTTERDGNNGWVISIEGSDRDAVTARMREVAEQLVARTFPLTAT